MLKTPLQMKWWGWGDPNKAFDISLRPKVWSFIEKYVGIYGDPNEITTPPVSLESIQLPERKVDSLFEAKFKSILKKEQIFTDFHERLVHSYGKSFRDLLRIRAGIVESSPDLVCYPESEEDVRQILRLAIEHNVVVIPFGGGSNIAGCLEAKDERTVLSLDMRRMNRVLEVDRESLLVTVEPGILGPELEEKLNAQGVTLGHFPDSFEYSSLGGWVATRSAGMQSDKYGKIEDMVISVRLVTPQGTIVTRTVPKASSGIDIKHLCIGSEGILGVLTQITLQVHALPVCKDYFGALFPSFEQGIDAVYECQRSGYAPAITRLNDSLKTGLSFAFKIRGSFFQELLGRAFKFYLTRIKKIDLGKCSLLIYGLEGNLKAFKSQKKEVEAIYQRHGGVLLGTSAGRSFAKGKYDFPYIRDFVMDRGIIADVSETSTPWSNLRHLYQNAQKEIKEAIVKAGGVPCCSCHISHTYQTGASLYFTFCCRQKPGIVLQQYLSIKKAAEDAFMRYGGTLSHHHAVGYEHLPWIEEEISPCGIQAVSGLKRQLDPKNIMNPGKIIPYDSLSQQSGPDHGRLVGPGTNSRD